MMKTPLVLTDSNVYIDLLRQSEDPAEVLVADLGALDLVTCGMVKMEVLRGVKHPRAHDNLAAFFAVQQFVPTDNNIWDRATDLARSLARSGITLPAQDILIATCAFHAGAAVLTADHHFSLIPDLNVIASPYRS